jgi:membrane-associated phospholipid phosphatase
MTVLARWVSILGHPFVMVALLVVVTALHFGGPGEAVRSLGLVTLLSVLPVAILMVRQVRRGSWKDADASSRRDRPVLFLVGAGGMVALVLYALLLRPQSFLLRGAVGTLAMLAACAVATRWLKVSLHMAFGALATTSLLLLGSTVGWALLLTMPVLAWSRLYLGRHKLAEVVAGSLAGVVSGFAIHSL